MKKILTYIILLIITFIAIVTYISFYIFSFSNVNYYNNVNLLGKNYIGLVFGSSVIQNNTPSFILKNRLNVTYEAYSKGKIKKIIVSGDNSVKNYNEPVVMQKYLIGLGVDSEDIYLDYAGFDTYDSLYRAKEIFGAKRLVLFTQDLHLKRAMYIGNKLGIKVIGVETNKQKHSNFSYYNRREIFARVKAFIEVEIIKPEPKFLGDKIEIISDEKIKNAKDKILEFYK